MKDTSSWEIDFGGIYAHVIKRPSGLHTFLYEIRYRKDGYTQKSYAFAYKFITGNEYREATELVDIYLDEF